MKILILSVLCFQLLECAIIPDIVTGKADFHQCLVSYIQLVGIRTELAVEDTLEGETDCKSLHASIKAVIETIYENMRNALPGGLHNETEIDCVMDNFKAYKFFEINIVLAAAHLTTPEIADNPLQEVHTMTKTIFAIAAMKCFWDDENLLEIVEDFSRKVNVSEKEFDCIVLDLMGGQLAADDEKGIEGGTTVGDETTIVEGTTELTTTEASTDEPAIELTDDVTLPNAITKLSPEDASVEATKSCQAHLEDVSNRIKHYEFVDLTHEQNQCMSNQLNASNVTAVYEVIFLQKAAKTPEDQLRRRELLESLIVGSIWNLVECTDIFGFQEFIIDDLLPHLE